MKKQGTTLKGFTGNRRISGIAKPAIALAFTVVAIAAIWSVPLALVDKQIKNIM